MIDRSRYRTDVEARLKNSPVVALLGPRQTGKTTLARQVSRDRSAYYFGLDSFHALEGHPKLGASWEGFALKQTLHITGDNEAYTDTYSLHERVEVLPLAWLRARLQHFGAGKRRLNFDRDFVSSYEQQGRAVTIQEGANSAADNVRLIPKR